VNKSILKSIAGAAVALFAMTAAHAADRFPPLTPDQMTPEQRKVADSILASRPTLDGPFHMWLRSPELGDRLQKVGEYIRFQTSLPHDLNEFAILIQAREWNAQFEWYVHYPLAIKAGLKPNVAADLQLGKRPQGMTPDVAMIYDFSIQLVRNKANIPDDLYETVRNRFGDQGVMDLMAVNGYYGLVSMTLNLARVALPPGEQLPLQPIK